jgi:hypothetical protein
VTRRREHPPSHPQLNQMSMNIHVGVSVMGIFALQTFLSIGQ